MTDILLTTFNARYFHSALGLRYLHANLGELSLRAKIREFNNDVRAADIVESLLLEQPKIIGIGVYIWNVLLVGEVVEILRAVRPDVVIVLGGPEVSFPSDQPDFCKLADYVVGGEGEHVFASLCASVLNAEKPDGHYFSGGLPALNTLTLPYSLYTDEDLAHRVIYVETPRGCPFGCEFCLSSLDAQVRYFDADAFLQEMEALWQRGARRFKFVDRTFNLSTSRAGTILDYFLNKDDADLFLHFEMVPDRLPTELRERLLKFAPGAVQWEVGVQTFDEEVARRIGRKQDAQKSSENIIFLREHTGVHLHTDLIVGLPGESTKAFGEGFDRLLGLGVQEIQVGILKRLRGAPISRHDKDFAMLYSSKTPYEITQTGAVDFKDMQRMKRFAHLWDRVGNSGNFRTTVPSLWAEGSAFDSFLAFTDWLFLQSSQVHGISLERLATLLHTYLIKEKGLDQEQVSQTLIADFESTSRKLPKVLRGVAGNRKSRSSQRGGERQKRHGE